MEPVGLKTDDAYATFPKATGMLLRWLSRALQPGARTWLRSEIDKQQDNVDERRLGVALGLAVRKLGRADLHLGVEDMAEANRLRRGWRPDLWSVDEMARVTLILTTYRSDDASFASRVARLCSTAELTEHIAYLKGFAIFPAAAELGERAREAVRASAQPLLQAIACHNPYSHHHFDQHAWNHMVVKCVFNGLPIDTIVGLNDRRNAELSRMLRDLVSERDAAGRILPAAVHAYLESD
jgi:hypothetical protein